MKLQQSFPGSFGEMLQTFRKRRCLTQRDLAQQLGVHTNTLSLWELGARLPATRGLVLELAQHLALSEPETRQLLEASLTALAPYWSVPLLRNLYFTGREEVLKMLYTQLRADQAVTLTQSSALHGLGGVGKTQIALEYAYRHALEYSAVLWIGAETAEQIVASLLCVAEVLHLPERADQDQQRVVAAVQRWLSTHGQWLLIWDNVEDLALLDRFLSPVRQGAMLITTRRQALGTVACGINLSPMEPEEGMLFLLRRAKILPPEASAWNQLSKRLPGVDEAVAELVAILGGLPLALDQAGAYIEEVGCSLTDYLQRYTQQRFTLLHRRGSSSGADHPQSVATTFKLAYERVAREQPAALQLLWTCAFLHPEAIPEELFVEGAAYLGPKVAALVGHPVQYDQAIAVLRNLSLLQRHSETQTLSMHRLVQAVLRDTMTPTEREQWNGRLIEALNAVFPESAQAATSAAWTRCERLLPHVLLRLRQDGGASPSLACASLHYKTGFYLLQRGQYTQAEWLLLHALQLREQALDPKHPEVAAALNRLALLFLSQARYQEAEAHLERALLIWEQVLGPEHPETVAALNNLAILCLQQGQYTEAEARFERALQIWEQGLGPEHPKVAAACYNLGDLYRLQGKYDAAEPLLLRALQVWERVWGPEDTDVAYALGGLAKLSQEVGNDEAAEAFFLRALRIRERWYGSEHPRVAEVLHGLAALALKREQVEQAEQFYVRALTLRERCLGPDHPETGETLHDLALLCQKQGNLSEALSFAEHVLKIRSQSLGDAHTKTITTRTLFAQLIQEQACAQDEAAFEPGREEMPDPRSEKRRMQAASLPYHKGGDPSSSENDSLQGFLDACCELHPRAWCRISDLWQKYERWAAEHQERFPLSRRAFAAQLKECGCCTDRTNAARIWRGITLVKQEP